MKNNSEITPCVGWEINDLEIPICKITGCEIIDCYLEDKIISNNTILNIIKEDIEFVSQKIYNLELEIKIKNAELEDLINIWYNLDKKYIEYKNE